MKLFISILFCFFLGLLLSCEKWNLEPQDFIEVEINSVEAISLDSVQSRRELKDHKSLLENVKSFGILCSTESSPLTIESLEGNQYFGTLNENNLDGVFTTALRMEPIETTEVVPEIEYFLFKRR